VQDELVRKGSASKFRDARSAVPCDLENLVGFTRTPTVHDDIAIPRGQNPDGFLLGQRASVPDLLLEDTQGGPNRASELENKTLRCAGQLDVLKCGRSDTTGCRARERVTDR
jgi:hypothetical protein